MRMLFSSILIRDFRHRSAELLCALTPNVEKKALISGVEYYPSQLYTDKV